MTDTDVDAPDIAALSALPQVDQTARTPQPRRPRYEGDVSELPDRACWALQNLMTRRYISADSDADLYSWVLEYRGPIGVRLSELDLQLRVVEGVFDNGGIAFIEQARYESARGVKLLRREPLGTYDSILALHLAQLMRASAGQNVVISREEMHGMFTGVRGDVDRDVVAFTARIDAAIARLAERLLQIFGEGACVLGGHGARVSPGLIEQDAGRIAHQRARDRQHLLLAAGHAPAGPIAHAAEVREQLEQALRRPRGCAFARGLASSSISSRKKGHIRAAADCVLQAPHPLQREGSTKGTAARLPSTRSRSMAPTSRWRCATRRWASWRRRCRRCPQCGRRCTRCSRHWAA